MPKLGYAIEELYSKAATSLPEDVEAALKRARRQEEKGSNARMDDRPDVFRAAKREK